MNHGTRIKNTKGSKTLKRVANEELTGSNI